MADEVKKPEGGAKPGDKPAPPAPAPKDPFVEIVTLFFGLFLFLYIVNSIIVGITSHRIFSRGWAGLSPQSIILSHTRPIASLLNPIGAGVVALRNISVYESAGGRVIGTQALNARGKILQGPVIVNGIPYYYVDFSRDPGGWVKESDIGYIESEPTFFERTIIFLFSLITFVKIFLFFLSILLIFAIVYIYRHISRLRLQERILLYPVVETSQRALNPQWERILAHSESQNQNDWRQAIMEADIVLDRMLDTLHLPGDTMADKLKAVEKSDFTTIDLAWEAHKVRNQIAHEGSDFQLSAREVKRVIELYRQVFDEFKII